MIKLRLTLFILVIVLLGLALVMCVHGEHAQPAAPQANYYVDPGGSDDTGDGSAGHPWQTIQHAAAQVSVGDTVLINPGSYTGGIIVDVSGSEAAPITFRANGEGVVIQGSGAERDAFFISEADYVVVEGLVIQDAQRAGLRISLADHVTVRGCTFANNGTWGVFTDFSDHTLVESCEIYGAVDEHGIYISNSSDYPTIRGNLIHHNYANGLHMNGDVSMGGDGVISFGLIERNVIYENGQGGGSGINMDGVTDTLVRNNLLYNNHASGISAYQIDGGSGSQRNRLLNNTIVMPDDGRWAINIPESSDTDNQVFNNIIYNAHSWRGSILIAEPNLSGFESDHNIVVSRFSTDGGDSSIDLADWQVLGYDSHSLIATPDQLFVDPSAGDYHLVAGCAAIDAGVSLPDVLDDLQGNARPAGSAFDIGAFEFGATGDNRAPNVPTDPDPANGESNVPLDHLLSWQGGDPDGDAVTYTVAFGAVSPPPMVTSTLQTSYTPFTLIGSTLYPGLISDTTYYWRITATDGLSDSVGALWSFHTIAGATGDFYVYLPVVMKGAGSQPPPDEVVAFPGAQGFGAKATGGRGGQVLKVTTLSADGDTPGGLQWALNQSGPRIIVFDVSGVIKGDVHIPHGDVTIAGQTAPGAGVTIYGHLYTSYNADVSNIIIRHLRVRPPDPDSEWPASQHDAIQFSTAHTIILDHVDASHGADEIVDMWGGAFDITVQWSAITYPIYDTENGWTHPKGLINHRACIDGGGCDANDPLGGRISIHHNLFAHCNNRTPALSTGPADVINNVIYNGREGFVHHNIVGAASSDPAAIGEFNIVGNTYIEGPSASLAPFWFDPENGSAPIPTRYWLWDNTVEDPGDFEGRVDNPFSTPGFADEYSFYCCGIESSQFNDWGRFDFSAYQGYQAVTTEGAAGAYTSVLQAAGAWPRDVVTSWALADVQGRGGEWGNRRPADWLEGLTPGSPLTDSDGDGMPNEWESAHGLDPNDGGDHDTLMPSGYTAIEEYVNELADNLVGQ